MTNNTCKNHERHSACATMLARCSIPHFHYTPIGELSMGSMVGITSCSFIEVCYSEWLSLSMLTCSSACEFYCDGTGLCLLNHV